MVVSPNKPRTSTRRVHQKTPRWSLRTPPKILKINLQLTSKVSKINTAEILFVIISRIFAFINVSRAGLTHSNRFK